MSKALLRCKARGIHISLGGANAHHHPHVRGQDPHRAHRCDRQPRPGRRPHRRPRPGRADASDPIAEGLITPAADGRRRTARSTSPRRSPAWSRSIRPDGSVQNLVTEKGAAIGGVAVSGKKVAYTINDDEGKMRSQLKLRKRNGKIRRGREPAALRGAPQPGQVNTYGFLELAPECAAQIPEDFGGRALRGHRRHQPVRLGEPGKTGLVRRGRRRERHPQRDPRRAGPHRRRPATAARHRAHRRHRRGGRAGAGVHGRREVRLRAGAHRRRGGPERRPLRRPPPGRAGEPGPRGTRTQWSASPPARGVQTVARGFLAATNLALDGNGRVYVTELFGDKVST